MKSENLDSLKHNMAVNVMDGAFFGMAMGFSSFVTVLPLYVSTMSDSALLIGLIPAIHSIGWQLPQLFTAQRVARQRRLKPMVLAMTSLERLPFLGLALAAWFGPSLGAQTTLALIFGLLIWQGFGGGFTATAWQSLIGKIMPAHRRGTFFGVQAAAANLMASLSAVLVGFILDREDSPLDFTLCFLLAFAAMVVSWFFLALTREQESTPTNLVPTPGSFWAGLGDILRRDGNFRWFLVGRTISQLAVMGVAFYTVFAVGQHSVSKLEIGWMTGLLMGIKILANPLMGWMADRWSHRGVMELGLAAATLSALLAWLAPGANWFYLVFALTGISEVALWTLGLSMTLEFGEESERPAYIGLANTLIAPANILAPFLGGWLADIAGYPAAFLASAVGGLAATAVFHLLVRDPVHATQSEFKTAPEVK